MKTMKKIFLFAAAASLAAFRLHASEVSYPSGGDSVRGYLAIPAGAGRHPALIVIHEWWGQNDWARKKADKFAGDGYIALAVDLYRGKSAGTDASLAHELMRGLPEDRAIRDLQAAFEFLAARNDVDASRIGSVGWCMGGGYSARTAVVEPRLAACAIYYGALPTEASSIEKIHAPILGNFGEADRGITVESVREFEKAAAAMKKSVDIKEYPGAGHGFASSTSPAVFKPEAARDADARTDQFFARWLKGK
jgi:carboxymethylenebutenolidase